MVIYKCINGHVMHAFPQALSPGDLQPDPLRSVVWTAYRSSSLARRVPARLHSTPACTTASLSMDVKNSRPEMASAISRELSNCLSETHLHQTVPKLGPPTIGKVRDIYEAGDFLILVTTDRLSAFDRILAAVPFKGQVLNQTSLWWFSSTKHITPNAVVSAPDPNVTIASKCTVFPVEFVVRGYVTGSTSTSLWTVYDKGLRNYCGNSLPEGLVKNQRLSRNILTPTTKAIDHDLPISGEEIVEKGLMSHKDFEDVREKALALFAFGQQVAAKHGLILVDTKYEFGKAPDGSILLIDEVHTPDSSRYWVYASYEDHFRKGLEPENIDKEFLRLWFRENCDPYNDEVLPPAPRELVSELARRCCTPKIEASLIHAVLAFGTATWMTASSPRLYRCDLTHKWTVASSWICFYIARILQLLSPAR